MNECPLGSAALAGTGFPIDRETTAQALGFDRPTANSLEASPTAISRSIICRRPRSARCICRGWRKSCHLGEQPFGFVRLSDEFSTGCSIMPQKKNPDAAELVRGHSGRIVGALIALMVTMKGLPLAYSKDMQDDKPPVFEARGLLGLSLAAMTGMVARPSSARTHAGGRRAGYLDRDRPR